MHAAAQGAVDVVKALVLAGADVNAVSSTGVTALMLAVIYENADTPDTVNALVEAGADINAADENGVTALMHAANSRALAAGRADVRALAAAGADVNAANCDGETALMFASESGNADAVNALVAAGADVNAANKYGTTAVYFAAANGHADAVKALMAAGADGDGSTTLKLAERMSESSRLWAYEVARCKLLHPVLHLNLNSKRAAPVELEEQ